MKYIKIYKTREELLTDLENLNRKILEYIKTETEYWDSYRLKGGKAEIRNEYRLINKDGEITLTMKRKILLNEKIIKKKTKTIQVVKIPYSNNKWIYSVWEDI